MRNRVANVLGGNNPPTRERAFLVLGVAVVGLIGSVNICHNEQYMLSPTPHFLKKVKKGEKIWSYQELFVPLQREIKHNSITLTI